MNHFKPYILHLADHSDSYCLPHNWQVDMKKENFIHSITKCKKSQDLTRRHTKYFSDNVLKNSMTRRQESEKEKWNSRWKGRPTLSVATSYQITSDKWSYCSTKSFWNCLFLCRKMRNKFFAASVFLCILIILTVWLNVKLGVHACVVYFQVGSQFNRSKKLSSETLSAMDGQWELFWSSFGQSQKPLNGFPTPVQSGTEGK